MRDVILYLSMTLDGFVGGDRTSTDPTTPK
jgi:hypothetical protein